MLTLILMGTALTAVSATRTGPSPQSVEADSAPEVCAFSGLILNQNGDLARIGRCHFNQGGDHWQNDNESLNLFDMTRKHLAPLPEEVRNTDGRWLNDGTLLVFGGFPAAQCQMPINCAVGYPTQASYRYLPKTQSWQTLSTLRIPHEFGESLDGGNYDIQNFLPRKDALVVRTGQFFYLTTDPDLATSMDLPSGKPIATTLHSWDPADNKQASITTRKGHNRATLLELQDGRLALIGGSAQRERVALEKECLDCRDEFVSLGTLEGARATEVFDLKSNTWTTGARSHYAGGHAVRLANGRIFKLSMTGGFNAGRGYSVEIADAALNSWTPAPAFPLPPEAYPPPSLPTHELAYIAIEMFAVGNRVYVPCYAYALQESGLRQSSGYKVALWDDETGSWSVLTDWKQELPLFIGQIDAETIFVQYSSSMERRSLHVPSMPRD